MEIEVCCFSESKNKQWYKPKDCDFIECNEEIINQLWLQWIMNPTAKKVNYGVYTIFKVTNPLMILDL